MSGSQTFRYQAIDDKGVVSGALAHFRQGRAPGVVYTDKAMRIPARNPLPANGLGVLIAYLPAGEEFEVTVTRPDGSFFEQFDSTSVTGVTERIIEQPEPKVIVKEVENPETIAKLEAAEQRLQDIQDRLNEARQHPAEAMLEELPEDEPEVSEEPPEAIADLFQSDRPYADQAKALWDKYNELTQKIMMNLATDAERAKHAKLQGELDWIKHHVFEAV